MYSRKPWFSLMKNANVPNYSNRSNHLLQNRFLESAWGKQNNRRHTDIFVLNISTILVMQPTRTQVFWSVMEEKVNSWQFLYFCVCKSFWSSGAAELPHFLPWIALWVSKVLRGKEKHKNSRIWAQKIEISERVINEKNKTSIS